MKEIIAFGAGYDVSDGIKVFVKSAKKHCDKLTVITLNVKDELIFFLQNEDVNVVRGSDLSEKYKVSQSISPYTLKTIFFYLYTKHVTKSDQVYLCDFTDIFIQRSPFELIKTDKVYVTSENYPIVKCDTNTTWINICYNSDIYNLLKDKEILNGGNILGIRESCVDLLHEMTLDTADVMSRIGNYTNIDQAILNKVVYFDKFRYNILRNKEIINLAYSSTMTDFSTTYVIHQYDVNKQLEALLYGKYK